MDVQRQTLKAHSSRDAGYVCLGGSVMYPKYTPFTTSATVAHLTRACAFKNNSIMGDHVNTMIENVLVRRNCSLKIKITVKSLISLFIIALAVALPQLVHFFAGKSGGAVWNPIFLPVLLGGCLLGLKWGLGIAVLSPLVSCAITTAAGNPMPAISRVPFMIAELLTAVAVAGAFSKKIAQNGWMAFPAVLLAHVAGRFVYMLRLLIFGQVTPLTFDALWSMVEVGFTGVLMQAVVVPFIVMGLKLLLDKDKKTE